MNDTQYQTGSSWALGGALRALGGALGSRYRRQKSAKNVPKILPKRRFRRALYAKLPSPHAPGVLWASERVGFSARACEREVDTASQRAESPVEVQEQREREQKRIGMGQVSAMRHVCTCAVQPRARLYTSHAARTRPPQSRPSRDTPEAGARRREGASGCHWPHG